MNEPPPIRSIAALIAASASDGLQGTLLTLTGWPKADSATISAAGEPG